ncbi:MAG TPA: hypothetical protein PLR30_10900, partial [Saprospiraceae bacterium]|nr:hypothetical protein [Saprospiraceae bacterium]
LSRHKAVFSPQSSVHSLQLAVFSRELQVFRLHERKKLAFQARQIELPRLSSRGPLMISRHLAVGSLQSALFCPRLLLLRQCTIPVLSSRSFLLNVTLSKPRDN